MSNRSGRPAGGGAAGDVLPRGATTVRAAALRRSVSVKPAGSAARGDESRSKCGTRWKARSIALVSEAAVSLIFPARYRSSAQASSAAYAATRPRGSRPRDSSSAAASPRRSARSRVRRTRRPVRRRTAAAAPGRPRADSAAAARRARPASLRSGVRIHDLPTLAPSTMPRRAPARHAMPVAVIAPPYCAPRPLPLTGHAPRRFLQTGRVAGGRAGRGAGRRSVICSLPWPTRGTSPACW